MKSSSILLIGFAVASIAIAIAVSLLPIHRADASVTIVGQVPRVATSSTIQVGPQAVTTVAGTSSACTSRVIGTVGTPIQLSFSQSINPTALIGNPQTASTTVAYNNDNYGCGAITAYGFASTTITITTFAQ